MTMMEQAQRLYLGVDGGGTGCRARLEDAHGAVLGQGLSGPATTRLGTEKAWASVLKAWRAAAEEAGLDPDHAPAVSAGIGIAGLTRAGTRQELESMPHPFGSTCFTTDGAAACLGAHSGRDGAIVIAGTGSIGLAIVSGEERRAGGYGFPISDEGSGADLGLKSIQAALRAHDGRREMTPLMNEVMGRFDHEPAKVVAWMDRATATDYATFAPLVFRHADQGEPSARQIVQSGAEQIDTLIRRMVDYGAPSVTLLGGLSGSLEPWLAPDVRRRLKPADGDAVSGAIILAKQMKHHSTGRS
ncbi:N-acetylglucosamine kinase [Rhizobium sp. SSA_523]|uniref:N-acetylglucosamine kinase n=1 Tax=Rhizobium sp. SSA_523 TaxID=2952477 RepID=UPI002091B466|nr:N-acetylglucosamine kinase [Rhizobium sp. SSA_523]MCO5732389.1 N-acetylglucosamine kinase [Rhizobium sp. SSA_523]WKC22465.1 N-acetylglucosamine kinase [Rhizobium sp. SSA_523]